MGVFTGLFSQNHNYTKHKKILTKLKKVEKKRYEELFIGQYEHECFYSDIKARGVFLKIKKKFTFSRLQTLTQEKNIMQELTRKALEIPMNRLANIRTKFLYQE